MEGEASGDFGGGVFRDSDIRGVLEFLKTFRGNLASRNGRLPLSLVFKSMVKASGEGDEKETGAGSAN